MKTNTEMKMNEETTHLHSLGTAIGAAALRHTSDAEVNETLLAVAEALEQTSEEILAANQVDLRSTDKGDYRYDRLRLDKERIAAMGNGIRAIAMLPTPIGRVVRWDVRDNGMVVRQVSVPLGVVGIIYEARPNVTTDVFALCLKSGNVCLLKGSHDAYHTNKAIVDVIHRTLVQHGIAREVISLLPSARAYATALMQADDLVDVLIPRGGAGLIASVRRESIVPVIETGAGICHAYFDKDGDAEIGRSVIANAKTRRVSVCNALDTLLVHADRLAELPYLCAPLAQHGVQLFADESSRRALSGHYPDELIAIGTPESTGRTEFLDYKMNVFVVNSADAAIIHINEVAGRHSETIITEDAAVADSFKRDVDAACVYVNVSTAFTDGGMFGLGAEVGISTQKLHARGPMGLEALTTTKWVVEGRGQVRKK